MPWAFRRQRRESRYSSPLAIDAAEGVFWIACGGARIRPMSERVDFRASKGNDRSQSARTSDLRTKAAFSAR